MKVLIVDPDSVRASTLQLALATHGVEVTLAPSGSFALTMLEWNTPQAILCATNLREMNAYEIPKILHGDLKTAHIPIIALGDGGEHSLITAFRAGCDDYIDRKLGPDQIAQHVRTFLKSHLEGFQPTQMLESQDTALEGSLSHLDLPGVIQMLSHSRQTGALHINAEETDGILFFDSGDVQHAESGDLIGDDAVIHIVKNCNGRDKGVYKFIPGDTAATRTVLRSITELMLDALRELDEEQGVAGGDIL